MDPALESIAAGRVSVQPTPPCWRNASGRRWTRSEVGCSSVSDRPLWTSEASGREPKTPVPGERSGTGGSPESPAVGHTQFNLEQLTRSAQGRLVSVDDRSGYTEVHA